MYVFDVLLGERPETVSPDLAHFWGGYVLEFKVIPSAKAEELERNIEQIRRNSVPVGPRGRRRFEVDISKFECCDGMQIVELKGYSIQVYTPRAVVCEKLRAICQQMPEYVALVKRQPSPRARDFLDIHDTVHRFGMDLTAPANVDLLDRMLVAKRVRRGLLGEITRHREFHRQDWPAVEATVRAGVRLRPFDEYFDFVLDRVAELKTFWDV